MHIRLKKIKGGRRRRKPCVQQCVYRRVCLLFQCNISELRRSGSTHCCSDSAGQRGHWKHHKKLPLSVCLQKQQFRLERKKHFPSWLKNIQKRPWPFFQWSQPFLWHAYGWSNAAYTHKLFLQLQRFGSGQSGYIDPNQWGYVGLQLHLFLKCVLSLQIQPSQYDSNRFHQRAQQGVITSNPWSDKSVST